MQLDWRMMWDPAFLASVLTLGAAGTLAARRRLRNNARNRRQASTAERLSAALDQFDIGIVLLNDDTRAEFINRAYRTYFGLPDDRADSRPPLIALMYHARDVHAYQLPEEEIDRYIAQRVERIKAGDPVPQDLRLANGQVLRMRCTALPDGGRMLSYTPITDIVRHNDDLTNKDYYLSLRSNAGDVFAPGHLHAAE
jgi:PAS domain-containing protein